MEQDNESLQEIYNKLRKIDALLEHGLDERASEEIMFLLEKLEKAGYSLTEGL